MTSCSHRSRGSIGKDKKKAQLEEYMNFKNKLKEQLDQQKIQWDAQKSYESLNKSFQKFNYVTKNFSVYSLQKYIEKMIDKG